MTFSGHRGSLIEKTRVHKPYLVENSFSVRAAQLLRRFRCLADTGCSDDSSDVLPNSQASPVLQQSHHRKRQLDTDVIRKLESKIWLRVFHLTCEMGHFDEASKLLSNLTIFPLVVRNELNAPIY